MRVKWTCTKIVETSTLKCSDPVTVTERCPICKRFSLSTLFLVFYFAILLAFRFCPVDIFIQSFRYVLVSTWKFHRATNTFKEWVCGTYRWMVFSTSSTLSCDGSHCNFFLSESKTWNVFCKWFYRMCVCCLCDKIKKKNINIATFYIVLCDCQLNVMVRQSNVLYSHFSSSSAVFSSLDDSGVKRSGHSVIMTNTPWCIHRQKMNAANLNGTKRNG